MAASFAWYDYIGVGATETATTNCNLCGTDIHDTGVLYQSGTARLTVPTAGTNYSYERVLRAKWTGTFNLIENIKFWKSAGTYSDAAFVINAGVATSYTQPVNTASSVATGAVPTSLGTALEPTYATAYSQYIYLQGVMASTIVTPGELSAQTFTMQWDES